MDSNKSHLLLETKHCEIRNNPKLIYVCLCVCVCVRAYGWPQVRVREAYDYWDVIKFAWFPLPWPLLITCTILCSIYWYRVHLNDYLAGCLINRKLLNITKIRGGFQTGVPGEWASYQIRKIAGCACAGMPGTFSPPLRVSDADMYHGTCVTHVPWYLTGSLTSGVLWSRWRRKRSWHSQCMHNPQFYVSGKRPMGPRNLLML